MDISGTIIALDVEAAKVIYSITEQGKVWADAYAAREGLRAELDNAERTLQLLTSELRGEQEMLRDLDKGLTPAERRSVLTAGDKDSREKQFDLWLSKLPQHSKALEEVRRIKTELGQQELISHTADRKIAALRTVADLQAARLVTLSKLV